MGQLSNAFAARYTKAQLETMLDAALSEAAGGKTLTSWSSLDSSAQRAVFMGMTPGSRASTLLAALVKKDPVAYPPEDFLPNTRTRPVFS